jgi:acetyl-CoA carboxylase biotin carboxyl carrier protein
MTLSADDIKALIADFNASDWEEIAITSGDVNIVISRSGSSQLLGRPTSSLEMAEPKVPLAAHSASPSPAVAVPAAPITADDTVAQPSSNEPQAFHQVTSPTVGLFWRSGQPGSPPFVEVGQRVEADDTVCIIEVMKLLNHVNAGQAGTVTSIAPQNGAMVEFGSVLMVIEPDA